MTKMILVVIINVFQTYIYGYLNISEIVTNDLVTLKQDNSIANLAVYNLLYLKVCIRWALLYTFRWGPGRAFCLNPQWTPKVQI